MQMERRIIPVTPVVAVPMQILVSLQPVARELGVPLLKVATDREAAVAAVAALVAELRRIHGLE